MSCININNFACTINIEKMSILLEEILCSWLLGNKERLISIFSSKNGHFFNINGAFKAIDVDTRREVVIKTWKTSVNNKSFSISQEPTAQYISSANTVQLTLRK